MNLYIFFKGGHVAKKHKEEIRLIKYRDQKKNDQEKLRKTYFKSLLKKNCGNFSNICMTETDEED